MGTRIAPAILMGMLDKIKVRNPNALEQGMEHDPAGSERDPVCHMTVDPAKSKFSSRHGAQTIYFCSGGCKTKFDADPHKYLGAHSH